MKRLEVMERATSSTCVCIEKEKTTFEEERHLANQRKTWEVSDNSPSHVHMQIHTRTRTPTRTYTYTYMHVRVTINEMRDEPQTKM